MLSSVMFRTVIHIVCNMFILTKLSVVRCSITNFNASCNYLDASLAIIPLHVYSSAVVVIV